MKKAAIIISIAIFYYLLKKGALKPKQPTKKVVAASVGRLDISNNGIDDIAKHEGKRFKAYKDTANKWTIGIGHLIKAHEQHLIYTTLSDEQVIQLFREDVKTAVDDVRQVVKVPLNQNSFDALVSFAFNVGGLQFRNSTLLRQLNQREPLVKVAQQFERWVYAGGKKDNGLVNRRQREKQLFLTA